MNLLKAMLAVGLLAFVVACGGSSGGGNGGSGIVNGDGSSSGANGNSSASLELNDGDVLGGGTSIVRIPASDDTGIVRVNSSIVRQGNLPECSARFVDASLTADSLIEACVSDQAACAVTFQPVPGQIEVIAPPLYAPIGIEFQLSLVDRDAAVTEPVNAVFCFDVGINAPPVTASDTFQITFPSRIERAGVSYGERCERLPGSQGVLNNDDDDEHITNSCLQAELVEGPQFASNIGSFASTFGSDGSFVYEAFASPPPENSDGVSVDSFTYVVSDGVNPPSAPVTVDIVFTSENRTPLASDDTFEINEDADLQILSVLANDSDPDALPLTIASIQNGPGNGVANVRNGTLIEYRPNAGFVGSDTFQYTIVDSGGLTATANVVVNILNVNDPPLAQNDTATTNENSSVVVQVLGNDSDLENNSLTVVSVTPPRNGTASVASESSVNYTPDANFFGTDSFEYTVSDGTDTATATVVVNVIFVNVGPVATTDEITVAEGNSVEFDLLANDTDGDSDALTIVNLGEPANGNVVSVSGGVIRYTPINGFNGQDQFSYVVSDGTVETTGQVNITVSSVNDAPAAVDDTVITAEDTAVIIDVLDNDTDTDGDALTVVGVTGVSSGTATINADGLGITFTPQAGFDGQVEFTYTIEDGNGGSDTATVSVVVTNVNASPIAADDATSTDENDAVNIDVLANDSDPDGDDLTLAVVSQPANGTATVSNGSIIYTPDTDFSGTDQFTYTITDSNGVADTASVTVTVSNVNAAPVAVNDSASTSENVAVLIPVIDNDTDADGDVLSLEISDAPSDGVASVQGDSILYTPDTGFFGVDEFSYTVTDTSGVADTASVTVTVSNTNAVPSASNDLASTSENEAVLIPVISNDTDPDGDALTIAIDDAPSNGTASIQGDSILYTPSTGFSGVDEFTYTVTDPSGATDSASVTITVSNVNVAPSASNDSASTSENVAVLIPVTSNDTDADGDVLTVEIDDTPSDGVAEVQGGSILYTPATDFTGVDEFSYTITDPSGDSDTASVTVTVSNVNAAPTASGDTAATIENTPVLIDVTDNDTDPDGDSLIVAVTSAPSNGEATVQGGAILYTPTSGFSGIDEFVYSVTDPSGAEDSATVTVSVSNANADPVAADDEATTEIDDPLSIGVLLNDSDQDGDDLSLAIVSQPENGTAALSSQGTRIVYSPDTGFVGVDSFVYEITDGNGGSANATVTVTVINSNSPPVALDDVAQATQGQQINFNILANDSDPDGDALTVTIVDPPENGIAIVLPENIISYTADADFDGADSIVYQVDDGNGATDTATVDITVAALEPVNSAPVAASDTSVTDQDVPVDIPVLANDSDPDGDSINVAAVSAPGNGDALLNADESISYTPVAGFSGIDTFEYTITDNEGGTATATVEVTVQEVVAPVVLAVNTPPVAVDDVAEAVSGSDASISVLDNDTDIDGDLLTLSLDANALPSNGVVSVSPDGQVIVYTSIEGFVGVDAFSYVIDDNNGGIDVGDVVVSVIDF